MAACGRPYKVFVAVAIVFLTYEVYLLTIGYENLPNDNLETLSHVRKLEGSDGPLSEQTQFVNRLPSYQDLLIPYSKNKGDSKLRCNTCALVSNSGILLHSGGGNEIDMNDCVIRMNDAPTIGFETDVGKKTTFRIFGFMAIPKVFELLNSHPSERNTSILVLLQSPKIGKQNLKRVNAKYPNSILYSVDEARISQAVKEFENGYGKSMGETWLSNGWFSMLLAKDLCGSVNVFGMIDEKYCEQVFAKKLPDSPYHYYDKGKTLQCAIYQQHEKATAGHRYITEKRIFKSTAKKSGKITFLHPNWDLS